MAEKTKLELYGKEETNFAFSMLDYGTRERRGGVRCTGKDAITNVM